MEEFSQPIPLFALEEWFYLCEDNVEVILLDEAKITPREQQREQEQQRQRQWHQKNGKLKSNATETYSLQPNKRTKQQTSKQKNPSQNETPTWEKKQ